MNTELQFLLYDDPSENNNINVVIKDDTIWATRFRQWATRTLNEYIRKGFVMDDERLKQGQAAFGKDYFRELLERVRSMFNAECIIQNAE